MIVSPGGSVRLISSSCSLSFPSWGLSSIAVSCGKSSSDWLSDSSSKAPSSTPPLPLVFLAWANLLRWVWPACYPLQFHFVCLILIPWTAVNFILADIAYCYITFLPKELKVVWLKKSQRRAIAHYWWNSISIIYGDIYLSVLPSFCRNGDKWPMTLENMGSLYDFLWVSSIILSLLIPNLGTMKIIGASPNLLC